MAQSRPTPARFGPALMGLTAKPSANDPTLFGKPTSSAAGPAGGGTVPHPGDAQSGQHDPASVKYTDTAPQCQGCTHFQAPSSCEIVSGPIQSSGWCKLFEDNGQAGQ